MPVTLYMYVSLHLYSLYRHYITFHVGKKTKKTCKSEGFLLCCVMINLVKYYFKTEYIFCKQTSFCDISTNNASSGLRKKLYLLILVPKYDGKIWCQYGHGGEEALLGGPYLPR